MDFWTEKQHGIHYNFLHPEHSTIMIPMGIHYAIQKTMSLLVSLRRTRRSWLDYYRPNAHNDDTKETGFGRDLKSQSIAILVHIVHGRDCLYMALVDRKSHQTVKQSIRPSASPSFPCPPPIVGPDYHRHLDHVHNVVVISRI